MAAASRGPAEGRGGWGFLLSVPGAGARQHAGEGGQVSAPEGGVWATVAWVLGRLRGESFQEQPWWAGLCPPALALGEEENRNGVQGGGPASAPFPMMLQVLREPVAPSPVVPRGGVSV